MTPEITELAEQARIASVRTMLTSQIERAGLQIAEFQTTLTSAPLKTLEWQTAGLFRVVAVKEIYGTALLGLSRGMSLSRLRDWLLPQALHICEHGNVVGKGWLEHAMREAASKLYQELQFHMGGAQ